MTLLKSYCKRCYTAVDDFPSMQAYSWCNSCKDTVLLTQCRVSLWSVGATMVLAMSVPLGLAA